MTDKKINITANTIIYYLVFAAIIWFCTTDAISFDTTIIAAILNVISHKASNIFDQLKD